MPARYDGEQLAALVDAALADLDAGREVPPPRLREVTRAVARAFAAEHPGRSVELRIPPYVAVQCVEGPRHTRGTPANVVETDPVTWLLLSAGRLAWDEARRTGRLTASGPRSDLSALVGRSG